MKDGQGRIISIPSKESVTPEGMLSMVAYGLCTLPLICYLKILLDVNHQPWYANYATIMKTWSLIDAYFDALTTHGPRYGFFPEPAKSIIVVPEGREDAASRFFAAYQFQIVTGTQYLGGFVGSKDWDQDWDQD